ncbi:MULTISPECIES: MurR/RpiR family transcriptional regulator [Enterococcus]|uniref:RpiR family transcriptional regulator n=2 Tax=Enterococcus alcedinis TaxID=1274384 RepID=A0A917N4P5_9ENTE|nr:MurR/RpiR family transcriptional regulator [Enterococcus alcedinis]MBP2101354.1 DNA-binding MurR/RpiR family transcriptional regulator [Enterococcus alcedinis]GGI65254.1 RpiR family transcriptional regulator [Enterococcus alcedinis]
MIKKGKKVGLTLQIQTSYNQLTKAEKKVADYILANPEKVLYMSITDLANVCEVGETSVYRFCRTMLFQGYQEFKMQLSLYLASEENNDSALDSSKLEDRVMSSHIQAIEESYQLLDAKMLQQMIEMMEESKKIYFFGVGDSLQIAQDAWNRFIRITDKVSIINDPHMQSMAISLGGPEDLLVLFSYSGATKDIIHIAKQAKEAGVKVVCITHFKQSPLIAYTDAYLLCGSKESPLEGGSTSVKVGQLFLVDLLFQTYRSRNKAVSIENQHKSTRAVVEKLV